MQLGVVVYLITENLNKAKWEDGIFNVSFISTYKYETVDTIDVIQLG
jgi:hypothetical protein